MYAIVDIETTGGNATTGFITEIAILLHDGSKVYHTYETLINPDCPIPPYITGLTGISNAMTATAPLFEEVAEEIFYLLKDVVFVAHNVNFDYTFLKHHLAKCGYNLNSKKLCTVRLARKAFPSLPSYSLGKLCSSLKIEIEDRHRAGGDARATVELLNLIIKQGGLNHISTMLKRNSSEQWLPPNLDKQQIELLPESPGVYYFNDKKGKVIYVGKAVNIKKRVKSHFTGTDEGMKRQQFIIHIFSVTFQTCSTELHALVLESTEIKRLWPKFNYSQKQAETRFGLYTFTDNVGYQRLAIDKKRNHLPALYRFNMLKEGMVMLRKISLQFNLNPYLCFLEKENVNENEEPENHNAKINAAINALNEQLPTYAVIEKTKEEKTFCLLIERGCFFGMGYIENEFPDELNVLKDKLEPYSDNDFIRNNIFRYAEMNPTKVISFRNF